MTGPVAIVTGAGQGIGEAIARRFVAEGYAVALAEADPITGQDLAENLRNDGANVTFIETDVADEEAVQNMVATTVDVLGPPSVLINNAGIAEFGDPLSMPVEAYRRNFQVDVDGVWFCCKYVLPHMLDAGEGSIVNMASINGVQIIPHLFPYTIAKHAVVGLTRTLAVEYGDRGVRVNALSPSYVETPRVFEYWETFSDPKAERRRCASLHPLRRNATPDDVANAAWFLASDQAGFITGVNLLIDGGRSIVYHDVPDADGIVE